MKDEKMKIYDIAEERELSLQEFWEDETPEETEYYIDFHISLIVDELRDNHSYDYFSENLFDSEVFFDESFFNLLMQNLALSDKQLHNMIYKEIKKGC